MKLADHQGKSLMTDETSAVEQAERRSKASVEDVRGVIEAALATTRSTAKEVSDRRWTELGINGPIGFRSGTDPEAKLEVERGVSVSHESRETLNQTKPKRLVLAHNQESHNYKPNFCKQIKRNSIELAESHRLFTVENKEKMQGLLSRETEEINELPSIVPEREQNDLNKVIVKAPSRVGRSPIRIVETTLKGSDLESSFQTEGAPTLINQTQINSNECNKTSVSVTFRKTPSYSVTLCKTPSHSATFRKTPYISVKPSRGTVGVLTDRPPGILSPITQSQDSVNTVGPVPMTFGYGPNTFPHSAAHVPNTNLSPSRSEGELINRNHTSAAISQNLSGFTKYFEPSNFSGVKTTYFTEF